MKICPKCETELEDSVTSCVSCGYHMDPPQRSRVGIAIKWLFIVFNVAMVCWVLVAMGVFDPLDPSTQEKALPHGTEHSEGIGVSMILMIWVICNAVLGVLLWDTRAKRKALQESNLKLEE